MWDIERLRGGHSDAEVIGWAKRLRHFYFMGAVSSGPVDLDEELHLRLGFNGREDLIHVLDALGLRPTGPGDSPITAYPGLQQPKHARVAGAACWVWVEQSFIDVRCATDSKVAEADVQNALRIEAHLEARGLQSRVDRTIATHANCVSAERFPERFARP